MRLFSFRPALDLRGRKFHGLRGFDGKPFHPPLTDIPIGAYVIAPVLDVAAYLGRGQAWSDEAHTAAGLVFALGAVFSVAAAVTGLLDWFTTERGTQIRRMANAHATLMVTMTLFVALDLALRYLVTDFSSPSVVMVALAAAILALNIIGGSIGGSMVYDFGFNVQTASDNPVYHRSEKDIVHPHDNPLEEETINIPETEKTRSAQR